MNHTLDEKYICYFNKNEEYDIRYGDRERLERIMSMIDILEGMKGIALHTKAKRCGIEPKTYTKHLHTYLKYKN